MSRKVLLNSVALAVLLIVAILMFFLLGDNAVPLMEASSVGLPSGVTTLG